MKIEHKSKDVVYITNNGWVYYIDDSTDEQIIKKWKNKYTQKEYQMLIQGMKLAVTAPTDEQSDKCIKIVEELSILFPKNIIEKAKKEVEFYINN
jgi:uncharacterized protein YjgD (DUF1641 family)